MPEKKAPSIPSNAGKVFLETLPADPQANPASPDAITQQQVVLIKDDQRYVFRYTPGEESRVLVEIVQQVNDPDSVIDWFDAAMLSHQLGHRLGKTLTRLAKSA